MKRKVLGLSLVMLLFIVMAAACAVPAVEAPAPEIAQAPEAPADTGTDPVTLRILDWKDSTLAQRHVFHDYFMSRHPHVTIEYTSVTVDQFRTSIVTMLRAGDAPDIFPTPGGITMAMTLNEGWYQALSPLVTDEFLASINPAVFVEGQTTRNGVVYTLPELLPMVSTLFYYNRDLLDASGIDELPATFSEFLDAARRITEVGNGQFFGIIDGGRQLNRLNELARTLTWMGGGKIAHAHMALTVDGRAPYDTPEMIAALEFINQLVVDGSFHPDTVNINAPEAREIFAQGQAAFISQGVWCIGPWAADHPELNFGVMAPPRPDAATASFMAAPVVAAGVGIYLNSEIPHIAAQYMMALYSEEYGYQIDCVAAGVFASIVLGINERHMEHPVSLRYFELNQELTIAIPVAAQRNEDVFDFYVEVIDVQPNLAAIVQGILAGAVPDIPGYLTAFADASTVEWQRASDAIGLDFAAFEFPNWIPGVPYSH